MHSSAVAVIPSEPRLSDGLHPGLICLFGRVFQGDGNDGHAGNAPVLLSELRTLVAAGGW